MEKQVKTEDKYKNDILNFYIKCIDTTCSDRRQVYFGQLFDSIFRWCENYVFPNPREMGLEIFKAVERMVKNDNKNIPQEKEQFFKYLRKSLKNARNEYYRNAYQNEKPKRIKLPRIAYDIEKIIEMRKRSIGRELTKEEKLDIISKIFNKTEKKALKYLEMLNKKDINSLDDFAAYDEPMDKLLSNQNLSIILDAVKSVLEKKQKRNRECNKALFTAYCIDKVKNLDALSPVLDREILDVYKTGKKPLQYEIYMRYRPGAQKASAEVRASETIKTFLYELYSVLEKKIP